MVDIRSIREDDGIADYVARYSARPSLLRDYSNEDRLEIFYCLAGRRLCDKWGTGRVCILSNKVSIDKSAFKNVGTWSSVVKRIPFSTFAKTIYKCWIQNRPLPEHIDLSVFDRLSGLNRCYDLAEIEYICLNDKDPPC